MKFNLRALALALVAFAIQWGLFAYSFVLMRGQQ